MGFVRQVFRVDGERAFQRERRGRRCDLLLPALPPPLAPPCSPPPDRRRHHPHYPQGLLPGRTKDGRLRRCLTICTRPLRREFTRPPPLPRRSLHGACARDRVPSGLPGSGDLPQRLRQHLVLHRRPVLVLHRRPGDAIHRRAVELLQRRLLHPHGRAVRSPARGAQLARGKVFLVYPRFFHVFCCAYICGVPLNPRLAQLSSARFLTTRRRSPHRTVPRCPFCVTALARSTSLASSAAGLAAASPAIGS